MVKSRGHLNPGAAGVRLDRVAVGLDALVRHVWIARWDLPDGQVRPQRVLAYPACNIVVTPDDASLYGPSPAVQIQRLAGRSWAVGVLFRPAAATVLTETPPPRLVGAREPVPHAPRAEIAAAMDADDDGRVTALLRAWLAPAADHVDEAGHTVNQICRIAEERDDITRVADLADLLGMTTRTLSRLVRHRIGVTPKWLIECRRLQRAATTLYTRPDSDLATLADSLGYADQAHFTRRYRLVLGESPDQTRRAGAESAYLTPVQMPHRGHD